MKTAQSSVPFARPADRHQPVHLQLFTALRRTRPDPLMFYGLHCEINLPATAEVRQWQIAP